MSPQRLEALPTIKSSGKEAGSRNGQLAGPGRNQDDLPEELRGAGTGMRLVRDFEQAATEVGRLNSAKTVTIDVGIIINPGWRQLLEARGYVHILTEGKWVKTVEL
jgi:GNAT superfamily N-acetyltransferase